MSLKQAMQSLRPPSPNEVCNIVAAECSKLLLLSSSSLCCNIKLVYALHGGCNGQSMSYLANITQCLGSRENEGKATTMEHRHSCCWPKWSGNVSCWNGTSCGELVCAFLTKKIFVDMNCFFFTSTSSLPKKLARRTVGPFNSAPKNCRTTEI